MLSENRKKVSRLQGMAPKTPPIAHCYLSNSSRPEKNLALLRDLPFPQVFADETLSSAGR